MDSSTRPLRARIKASCSSNPMPTNPPHGRGVDSPDDSSVGAGATAPRLPTRFARNAVSNYAFTGVLVVVALVTTPILTHHLGAQEYGVWILVGSVITYAQLLDLGLGGAVVSAVARLSAEGDDDGLERTLNSSFFVLAGLGVVALVLCGVAARFLPSAIHLHQPLAGTTRDLLLLLGVDVAVSIPMDTFGCGLVALQRYDLLNATLIAVAVTQAVAWTIVLVSGGGLLLLGVVTVVISLVGQGIRFVLLRRLLPALSLSAGRVDRALMRSLASPAGWYALGDSLDNFRRRSQRASPRHGAERHQCGCVRRRREAGHLGDPDGAARHGPLLPACGRAGGPGRSRQVGRRGAHGEPGVGRCHHPVLSRGGGPGSTRPGGLGRLGLRSRRRRRGDPGRRVRAPVLRCRSPQAPERVRWAAPRGHPRARPGRRADPPRPRCSASCSA